MAGRPGQGRGVPKSEEHKRRISEALKGRPKSPETIERARRSAYRRWAREAVMREMAERS